MGLWVVGCGNHGDVDSSKQAEEEVVEEEEAEIICCSRS